METHPTLTGGATMPSKLGGMRVREDVKNVERSPAPLGGVEKHGDSLAVAPKATRRVILGPRGSAPEHVPKITGNGYSKQVHLTRAHSSNTHNSPKLKTTQVPGRGRVHKQNVTCTHRRRRLSHRKESSSNPRCRLAGARTTLTQRTQTPCVRLQEGSVTPGDCTRTAGERPAREDTDGGTTVPLGATPTSWDSTELAARHCERTKYP